MMKGTALILVVGLVVIMCSTAGAATYNPIRESTNYAVESDTMNSGGSVRSSSNYGLADALGGSFDNAPISGASVNMLAGNLGVNTSDNDGDGLIDSEELFNHGTDADIHPQP